MTNDKIIKEIGRKRAAIADLDGQRQGINRDIENLKSQLNLPFKAGDVIQFNRTYRYEASKKGRVKRYRLTKLRISDTGEIDGGEGITIRKDGSDGAFQKLYCYELEQALVVPLEAK